MVDKFSDIMNEIKSLRCDNAILILGQGFSKGYDTEIDSEEITIQTLEIEENKIKELYSYLNSPNEKSNLEDLIEVLEAGEISYFDLHKILCNSKHRNINFTHEIWDIYYKFISKFMDNHKFKYEEKIKACIYYLRQFHQLYTLNFDFILYWSFLRCNKEYGKNFGDGFGDHYNNEVVNEIYNELGKLIDESYDANFKLLGRGTNYNVHYLHGAAHIYQVNEDVIKLTADIQHFKSLPDVTKKLVEALRKTVVSGNFDNCKIIPTIVMAGSHQSKERQIYSSPYLHKMYSRLELLKGPKVIYGCSVSSENNKDFHIWRRVFKEHNFSLKGKIYCGIYVPDGNVSIYESEKNSYVDVILEKYNIDNELVKMYIKFYMVTNSDNIFSITEEK